MTEPFFLDFVAHLRRDNQKTGQRDGVQLDLFQGESETLASLIVLDVVRAITEAGGNLGTLKIQLAVNAARERAITLLTTTLIRNSPQRGFVPGDVTRRHAQAVKGSSDERTA
jgi:hypothetical protein